MSKVHQDFIVLGAGAFGGWTAWYLLQAGYKVTLIDPWGPGNSRASSGGESRLIRMVYGGNKRYTAWTTRAWELWEYWQAAWNTQLLYHTGLLWMFEQSDEYVQISREVLRENGLSLEEMSVSSAHQQYPQINWEGVNKVWREKKAGFLTARRACQVLVREFIKAGGVYLETQGLPGAIQSERLSHIQLASGETLEAEGYVFACGPWLPKLFPEVLGDLFDISRQEIYYFGTPINHDAYRLDNLPPWIHFGERTLYGVPDRAGRGFKVADDTREETCDPSTMSREPRAEWILRSRQHISHRFPFLKDAPLIESRVCQYANTRDGHFILDQSPTANNIWLMGGGSGHGYKMGPAIGEYMADVILGNKKPVPEFSLSSPRQSNPDTHQLEQ